MKNVLLLLQLLLLSHPLLLLPEFSPDQVSQIIEASCRTNVSC